MSDIAQRCENKTIIAPCSCKTPSSVRGVHASYVQEPRIGASLFYGPIPPTTGIARMATYLTLTICQDSKP